MGKNARVNAYQVPADPTDVMGKRIGAYILDVIITALVSVLLGGAVFLGLSDSGDKSDLELLFQTDDVCGIVEDSGDDPVICATVGDNIRATEGGDSILVIIAFTVPWILNRIVLEGLTGASVGKAITGLRTVQAASGRACGIGRAILRTLVGVIDQICFGVVGLVLAFSTKGHRRLGDMAAGTLVVDKGAMGTPPYVPGLSAPAGAMAGAAGTYGAPEGAWSAPQAQPPGWGTPPPPPPGGEAWAPPAPQAPQAPEGGWGAPTTPPPPEAAAPEGAWSTPTSPEGARSAPAPATPAEPEPAPEPAEEPRPWEPSYEQPAPGPEAAVPEPTAPVVEPVTPTEPEPAPQPEPAAAQPEAAAPPEAESPSEPTEPSGATAAAAAAAAEPTAQAAEQSTTQASSTPGVGAPMWDPARNAYIQWDPSVGSWMQWDDAAQQWRPIS